MTHFPSEISIVQGSTLMTPLQEKSTASMKTDSAIGGIVNRAFKAVAGLFNFAKSMLDKLFSINTLHTIGNVAVNVGLALGVVAAAIIVAAMVSAVILAAGVILASTAGIPFILPVAITIGFLAGLGTASNLSQKIWQQ